MAPRYKPSKPTRTIDAVVVGISRRAKAIGLTVPIGYVEQWNWELTGGDDASIGYSSLVVTLRGSQSVKPFAMSAIVANAVGN